MDKEVIEFLNEIMDCNEVPRRLRLAALQIKTTPKKTNTCGCGTPKVKHSCENCGGEIKYS